MASETPTKKARKCGWMLGGQWNATDQANDPEAYALVVQHRVEYDKEVRAARKKNQLDEKADILKKTYEQKLAASVQELHCRRQSAKSSGGSETSAASIAIQIVDVKKAVGEAVQMAIAPLIGSRQQPLAITQGSHGERLEQIHEAVTDLTKKAAETLIRENKPDVLLKAAELFMANPANAKCIKRKAANLLAANPPRKVIAMAAAEYTKEHEDEVEKAAVAAMVADPPQEVIEKAAAEYMEENEDEVHNEAVSMILADPPQEVIEKAAAEYTKENEDEVEEAAVAAMVADPPEEVIEKATAEYMNSRG